MSFFMAPPAGLEPATRWLTVRCSANWAIEEYSFVYKRKITSVIFHSYLLFRQLSTLPGSRPPSTIDVKELNFRVRHGNGWILLAIVTGFSFLLKVCTLKTKQYINAFLRVFLSLFLFSSLLTISLDVAIHLTYSFSSKNMLWSSPRTISTTQLHTLLHFHLWPINQVVFLDPYRTTPWEILSWRGLHA